MSQFAARSAGEAHDWLGTLEDVPLFAGVPKRHVRRVAKLARVRRFAPGSTLVRAGDSGRSFFVLLDGTAKVLRGGARVRRLGSGDYFGQSFAPHATNGLGDRCLGIRPKHPTINECFFFEADHEHFV